MAKIAIDEDESSEMTAMTISIHNANELLSMAVHRMGLTTGPLTYAWDKPYDDRSASHEFATSLRDRRARFTFKRFDQRTVPWVASLLPLISNQLIFGDECTEAEGRTWHHHHFQCADCSKELGGQKYMQRFEEGLPSLSLRLFLIIFLFRNNKP
ncbi:LIM domain protein, partial [Cooperia oncophora]